MRPTSPRRRRGRGRRPPHAAATAAVVDAADVDPAVVELDRHRRRLRPDPGAAVRRDRSGARSLARPVPLRRPPSRLEPGRRMIVAQDVELRAGARVLLEHATFRVGPGDRVGLVGRNGAGKTTLTRVLAGEAQPAAGTVTRSGDVGLPAAGPAHRRPRGARPRPDPRPPAGWTRSSGACARPRARMASADDETPGRARWPLRPARGRSSRPAAATPPSPRRRPSPPASGCPTACSAQPLGTLSGGQRRRVELARILFSGAETLLLDEPTNHLDADSIVWLRDFLRAHKGGLVVISHDVGAARGERQQGVPPRRQPRGARRLQRRLEGLPRAARDRRAAPQARARQRREAGRRRSSAGRQDARQGDQGQGRAGHGPPGRAAAGRAGGDAACRPGGQAALPRARRPAAGRRCARRAVEVVRLAGGLHRRRPRRRPRHPGRRPRPQRRRARPPCCACSAGSRQPDTGEVEPGHGLRLGYYAQEHETLDAERTVLENMRSAAPDLADTEVRKVLGSFLFSGDDVDKPAGVLSGGEKTRLALATLVVSGANVLLLDEPTNNLDPASRAEVLDALRTYARRRRAGHARRGSGRGPAAGAGRAAARRGGGPVDGELDSSHWHDRALGRSQSARRRGSPGMLTERTRGIAVQTCRCGVRALPPVRGAVPRRTSAGDVVDHGDWPTESPADGRARHRRGGRGETDEGRPDHRSRARQARRRAHKKYEAGASIRELAEETGPVVRLRARILSENGASLRGRGGATRGKKANRSEAAPPPGVRVERTARGHGRPWRPRPPRRRQAAGNARRHPGRGRPHAGAATTRDVLLQADGLAAAAGLASTPTWSSSGRGGRPSRPGSTAAVHAGGIPASPACPSSPRSTAALDAAIETFQEAFTWGRDRTS